LLLALASVVLSPPVATAGPARVAVSARIYNTAQVTTAVKATALDVLSRTLAAGGIDVSLADCDGDARCAMVPVPGELVVRFVRSLGVQNVSAFVLGEASLDMGAGSGVLATVHVDHIERTAALSGVDASMLLGRAMAHEVGHLLLGTNAHSRRGLMRARWSADDLRRNDGADWTLTENDAAAIRRRLQ
jgi:hypothetical protein